MVNLDWLTEEEYQEAYKQAQVIIAEFYADIDEGEQLWTEIQIGDRFFDIDCWECDENDYNFSDFGTRQNPVHATLYPVIWDDEEGYRVTDWDRCIRLLTIEGKS